MTAKEADSKGNDIKKTTANTTTATATRPRLSSPSNSYYAMSDDEEGEYNTITHLETGKGVKLLYSKSKVYIHPSPSPKDNIAGYIALLQQKSVGSKDQRPTSATSDPKRPASDDLLLAWLPEHALGDSADIYVKVDLSDGDSPPKQTFLVPPPPTVTSHQGSIGHYAFAVPVSAVYSIIVRPPSLGWWFGSVIINSRAGESFPPLFFHDSECQSTILKQKARTRANFDPFGDNGAQMFWGGDEVLRWLRRYVEVERSEAEANIYLVEPSREDSEAFGGKPTFTTLGLKDDAMRAKSSRGGASAGAGGSSRDAQMDPVMKFVKEAGWNLMEKFSKVTTFTRNAAQEVLDNPRVPAQVRTLMRNPEVKTLQDEFDSARIYLARWAMGIAEQSEKDRSRRMWTSTDIMELEDTDVGEFELIEAGSTLALQELRRPVTLKEWHTFFDPSTGRLSVTIDEVKERIFHGGLDAEDGVRKEAWLFLLGVYEWYSTEVERKAQIASLRDEYVKLKGAWWERLVDMGGDGEEGEWWREQRNRIEKDVHRTDRNVPIFSGEAIPHPDPSSPFAEVGTNVHMEQLKDLLLTYNEYNRTLGYVQGMSDLLAPIYAVVQDDAIAFWGFQKFMERMERNFLMDQSGMRNQLTTLDQLVHFMDPKLWNHLQKADSTNFFFFFRMLLVWFKREFGWGDVLGLWERLWTDYYSSGFHLFVALAMLEKHRDVIMEHLQHFDEVLKYVNELSGRIDLESTLIRAEALFKRFQRLIEAIDKKSNFPAAPTTQKKGTVAAVAAAAAAAEGTASSPITATGPAARNSQSAAANKSAVQETKEVKETKVITTELRRLLSREVEVLKSRPERPSGSGRDTEPAKAKVRD